MPLVWVCPGNAPRASGGAWHHGVRCRRRRGRGPARPYIRAKPRHEFSGLLRYRPTCRAGNLAYRRDMGRGFHSRCARGRGRGAPFPDECLPAPVARATASLAGILGVVFSHRCNLSDCHALSRRRRQRCCRVFPGSQRNDGRLARRHGPRLFRRELHYCVDEIRSRSRHAGIFRRDARSLVERSAPRMGLGRRRHRCCGCRTLGARLVVHCCWFDRGCGRWRLSRRPARMNTDLGTFGVWMAILAMALVTYAIRSGGFWLMGYVPLTRRVRSILNALPGSVIVAIILPLAVRGGTAATVSVITALAVMALRRNDLLAVICGVGIAAFVRALVL